MCFHVPTSETSDSSPIAALGDGGKRVRRPAWWGPLGVGASGSLALGYVVMHDPSQGSVVPGCPFLAVTGWWCPGCGMTRATHALAHGDINRALRLNLFVIPILGALGLLYAGWAAHSIGLTSRSLGARLGSRPALMYAVVVLLIAFAVVRNLPGFEFLVGQ